MKTEDLIDIKAILNKELAEVTIDPKMDYSLDWEDYTPREYQKLLFRLREAVNADIRKITDAILDRKHTKTTQVYRIVFYLIRDCNGEQKECPLYETPYASSFDDCLRFMLKKHELPNFVWELMHSAKNKPDGMFTNYKPDYIEQAWTKHKIVTEDVEAWLRAAIGNPESLRDNEENCDCYEHYNVSEPSRNPDRKYDIEAYVRFELANVIM